MEKEVKDKIVALIKRDNKLKFALEGWKNRMHSQWSILEVWQCIYDAANGNSNEMVNIIKHLTDKTKRYGRANAAYGSTATNGVDIIRNENGVLELVGYNPDAPLTLKGQHGNDNPNIVRKSDGQTKERYKNLEKQLYDVGQELRDIFPTANNVFITQALMSVKKYAEKHRKNMSLVVARIAKGRLKFDEMFNLIPCNGKNEGVERNGKVIMITEDMAHAINEEMKMTEYKFYSNIKQFLHDLLVDPVNAQPSYLLLNNGCGRNKLLYYLVKNGIVEKEEKISDKDSEGNYKTAKMKTRYKVPKKNLERKLKRIYIKLFEKNLPVKETTVNEDGEGCCGGDAMGATSAESSGQYSQPLFPIQRRTMKEDTTTSSVGEYQYDVPFSGDDETMERNNGVGGSTSINHIDEYFDKNMSKVKKSIENAKDDWGDKWADKPYGEDNREVIHNEWMVHFSEMKNLTDIAKNGFTMGNRIDKGAEQVTYQRSKYNGGFNYAYLASDVLEAFDAKTDVELNDLRSSFMYYLSQERGDGFIMFRGNGFRFFHIGDAENQVVFNNIVPNTKVLILPLYGHYCVMNSTNPKMNKNTDKQIDKTVGGRKIRNRQDNPKNMMDNILFYSRDIEKVIQWVMTNYEQYKKQFNY